MKSLEVTDEQYALVQHLREEISEQVVGKYGHVREKDAVQFLIDNLDDDLEMDGEFDAADVSSEPIQDVDEFDDLEEVSYDESDEEATDESGEGETDEPADTDERDGANDEVDESDEGVADDGSQEGSEDAGDTDDGGTGGGAADDDDMLDEMMSLLETHEDKWEESSSGEHRYSVELPDGSTEEVQTKDDVRAILFKNYR